MINIGLHSTTKAPICVALPSFQQMRYIT